MTRWVADPAGGRARGPRAVARAWVAVLTRPERFFRTGVAPGDQGPGFVFTVAVTGVAVGSHTLAVPAARPTVAGGPVASAALLTAVVAFVAAPLALHLVAAVQTAALLVLADERGTISETVQVLAYATAPCVVAGLPVPALRLAAAAYGTLLLVLGTRQVHGLSTWRAALVAAVPAALVFGVAAGGVDAAAAVASGAVLGPIA